MISTAYVEESVADHPRTRSILERLPKVAVVPCRHYGEVFNIANQNFRLQKKAPALILAAKEGKRVLPTPPGYGIGGADNYYFSPLLNCPYDCRYCFLQGMFRSAHLVVFVNLEDFTGEIAAHDITPPFQTTPSSWFFSGYDADSLALDGLTGFAGELLDFFATQSHQGLELRTKSTHTAPLLQREPLANVVVAWSLSPNEVASAHDHGAPPVERRLEAAVRVQERGWPIGLRFDPVIVDVELAPAETAARYDRLFSDVFSRIDPARVHSVSLGAFRMPADFHRRLQRLYPFEPLFAGPLEEHGGMTSYPQERVAPVLAKIEELLLRHIPAERYHPALS